MAKHNYILSSSNNNNNDKLSLAFESSSSSSTPGLSFPLGTGLVVLIILVVSAIFSFCYHWLKLRKDATTISPTTAASSSSSSEAPPSIHAVQPTADDHKITLAKLATLPCPPVVYMAGEDMPRFIALPCPHFVAATLKHAKETDEEKAALGELMAMDLKLDIRL